MIQYGSDRNPTALRLVPPPPVAEAQPSPPAIWIAWDERGKELSPSTETETLQEARFELSVETGPLGDWSLTGYQWSYPYPPLPGQSYPADGLPVLAQGQNNRFATGIVQGSGISHIGLVGVENAPNEQNPLHGKRPFVGANARVPGVFMELD